ncbi:hypothetical protein JKL49_13370 [Phenylobacterium sp. 20VBR1]|uniref:DUF1828 domain-containing protein n=1 Tax=Phenylobacterium glaciei TaxID=2803784 RepID=A0A941D2J7_9CAUL|nr:hypothetical protein [Phenylobacterium glaciei]MBR7620379.1 hypothetical protein [Phenylobacterium glaciei]
MSLIFDLKDVLNAVAAEPDVSTRVETTTLLPGGGVATVSVRPAGDSFVVSDDGAARETMLSLGLADFTRGDARRAREIAQARGLSFERDTFMLQGVGPDQIGAAIAYVADATRTLVAEALEARTRRSQRDLVSRTIDRLHELLPSATVDAERELLGASTKAHRFDLVMSLPGDRYAVFQTVTPSPASIAPAHLKLYDLRQAHADWPREVVVEDLSAWPSEDLAIMQQVADHVRDFKAPWNDLRQLAA